MRMMNKALLGVALMTMTTASFADMTVLTYTNTTANTEVVASINGVQIADIKPGQSFPVSPLKLVSDLKNCSTLSSCVINYAKADGTLITSITVGATLSLPPKVTVLDMGPAPLMYSITINGTDYTQMKGKALPVPGQINIGDKKPA